MKKNAKRTLKFASRAQDVSQIFAPFSGNEWVFDSKNVIHLLSIMTEEEK